MEGDAAMLQHNVIPTKLTAQREAASEKGHPGALHGGGLRTPAKYIPCAQIQLEFYRSPFCMLRSTRDVQL